MTKLTGVILPSLGTSDYGDGKRLALRKLSEHYNSLESDFNAVTEQVKSGNAPANFKAGFFDTIHAVVDALGSTELDEPGTDVIVKKAQIWICGNGDSFKYGDKDWHYEAAQFIDEDGYPVPAYCTKCSDSSSLIPQF